MLQTDKINDSVLGALLQHLYLRVLTENATWYTLIELQRIIEGDIAKAEGDPKTNGKRRHNLYVLQDSLLVRKAEIAALSSLMDRVDAALDRRGYTGDERAAMKRGNHVW